MLGHPSPSHGAHSQRIGQAKQSTPANSMQNLTSLRTHTSGSLAVSGLSQSPIAASNMMLFSQNRQNQGSNSAALTQGQSHSQNSRRAYGSGTGKGSLADY